jgi:hypothetical protein
MSLSQQIDETLIFGDATLGQILEIEAKAAYDLLQEEIALMRVRGLDDAAITDILDADFKAKGRIFGQIDTKARSAVVASIINASNEAQEVVFNNEGFSDERVWVVVNLGPNAITRPCPDCPTRQGQVEFIQDWEARGLPGSGWSVCKGFCYCQLVPVEVKVADNKVDII